MADPVIRPLIPPATGPGRSRLEVSETLVATLRRDPDIEALGEEYDAESRSPELPRAEPQWERYEALAQAGLLDVVAARQDGRLIGFISVLCTTIPHYGVPISVVESLFVTAGRRRTGAGLALIRAAEAIAARHGTGLLITAPAGSALEAILPHLGYRRSHTVFAKGLAQVLERGAPK